ncbi:MAG: hypothetical protein JXR37_13955 [Kiritimatiellae bacterium]|nr:hypothetical protein [Kiritimatiellia bacterium]
MKESNAAKHMPLAILWRRPLLQRVVPCLITLPLVTNIANSATIHVGPGRQYPKIQAAVDAAHAGDTLWVHAGTYRESVTIRKPDLTLQSVTEWEAVLDGNGRLDYAFRVDSADRARIIGFKIQNYNVDEAATTYGMVDLRKSAGSEVKWNYLTGNHTAKGLVYLLHAAGSIVRGNTFKGNAVFDKDTGDHASIDATYISDSLIELNRFLDVYAGGGGNYAVYVHGSGDSANQRVKIRHNHMRDKSRLRKGILYEVTHNIVEHWIQFHDDSDGSDATEQNRCERNTFCRGAGSQGILSRLQQGSAYSHNLFVGLDIGIYNLWADDARMTFTANHFDGVPTPLKGYTADEYTESGRTTGDSGYEPATGRHNRLARNQGADLRIDLWPFTTQSGGVLAHDYPYALRRPSEPKNLTFR